MVESLESRILIGREPLLKFFKGGTLTIENLCQLMNFGLILSHGGCYIITGPSGCLLDYNRGVKGVDIALCIEIQLLQRQILSVLQRRLLSVVQR